ncbi:TPA: hypothetical protein SAQ65_005946 [Bacillus cereus]|nr:hypothetical protein [Bacillus cereus]
MDEKLEKVMDYIDETHDLTISMMSAMQILVEQTKDIELHDLLFVLTCFRDNAKHDDVYEFLNKVLTNKK